MGGCRLHCGSYSEFRVHDFLCGLVGVGHHRALNILGGSGLHFACHPLLPKIQDQPDDGEHPGSYPETSDKPTQADPAEGPEEETGDRGIPLQQVVSKISNPEEPSGLPNFAV